MDEFRMRLALQEIARTPADPASSHDTAWFAALAAAALGIPTTQEAEAHLVKLAREAPAEWRVNKPLPDGIGHLTVTMTYNSISREEWFSHSHGIRVLPGPMFPKRTIIRGRVQRNLDGMLDQIEQCETTAVDAE